MTDYAMGTADNHRCKDGKENQTVNYIGLIALLVKEIQELKMVLKSKHLL